MNYKILQNKFIWLSFLIFVIVIALMVINSFEKSRYEDLKKNHSTSLTTIEFVLFQKGVYVVQYSYYAENRKLTGRKQINAQNTSVSELNNLLVNHHLMAV